MAGAIVLACTGGTPTKPGTDVPRVDFSVSLNTQITSRLSGGASSLTETTLAVSNGRPNSAASGDPSNTIISGTLTAFDRVTFFGVPLDPPGAFGSAATLTISNLRGNASSLYIPGSKTPASMKAVISNSAGVEIKGASVDTGTVMPGLVLDAMNATEISQCSLSAIQPAFTISISEGFADALSVRGAKRAQGTATAAPAAAHTRFRVSFSGVAPGIVLYVPLTLRSVSTGQDASALVATLTSSESGPFSPVAATDSTGDLAAVTNQQAVYEITSTSATADKTLRNLKIPVSISYSGDAVPALGTGSVQVAYAPVAANASADAEETFTADSTAVPAYQITSCAASSLSSQSAPQSAAVNGAFPGRLEALLRNSGKPVADSPVTFRLPVNGPGAIFNGGGNVATVYTNTSGVATSPRMTANNAPGPFSATAEAGSLKTAFVLTNSGSALGAGGSAPTDPSPQAGGSPFVYIDAPAANANISGTYTVSGYAFDNSTTISSVRVLVDNTVVGNATYGTARQDVCNYFGNKPGCPNVGYTYALNTNSLTTGNHTLTVSATNSVSPPVTSTTSVAVVVGYKPSVLIDAPVAGSVINGVVSVSGWAVDNSTAISSVTVAVDGTNVGSATYGQSRADVCSYFGNKPGCPNVGYTFSLNTSPYSTGYHTISVTATNSDGVPLSSTVSSNVYVGTPPLVYIDTPTNNQFVSGTITVSGWAVDNATAVSSVQIKVDGNVVGTATYGSSRQDVCNYFGNKPGCPNVGFTYFLSTSNLSPGNHTLTATAMDSDSMPLSSSASVTVSASPVLSYIDSPQNGAIVSGTITVSGWAIGGLYSIANVQVQIDSNAPVAATYGLNRQDVCNFYGNRPGCPNVGYSYSFDVTSLSGGAHTITVIATDTNSPPVTGSATISVLR